MIISSIDSLKGQETRRDGTMGWPETRSLSHRHSCTMKKMVKEQRPKRPIPKAKTDCQKAKISSLKSITPGEHLRLRDDVYRHLHTREWIFRRVERDHTILLMHESAGFGWNVKMDDIDWRAYRESKREKELLGKG